MAGKLTVLFEDPFWVAIAETEGDEGYAVARHVFGGEPSGAEVREWVLGEYRRLAFEAVPEVATPRAPERVRSPKRAQREAAREVDRKGLETRAQEAMRIVIEQRKVDATERGAAAREAERERKWACRLARKKKKHRGR